MQATMMKATTSAASSSRARRGVMTLLTSGLAVALMLVTPISGHAADPSDLGVSYKTVVKGKQKPALVLQPTEAIRSITISLKGDKGESRRLKAGRIKAGATKTLSFKQKLSLIHI